MPLACLLGCFICVRTLRRSPCDLRTVIYVCQRRPDVEGLFRAFVFRFRLLLCRARTTQGTAANALAARIWSLMKCSFSPAG